MSSPSSISNTKAVINTASSMVLPPSSAEASGIVVLSREKNPASLIASCLLKTGAESGLVAGRKGEELASVNKQEHKNFD